jgi:hypothetical protein
LSIWSIDSTSEYLEWFSRLDEGSKRAILRSVMLLEEFGPSLGRPHVDTIKGSKLKNLKELRSHAPRHVYRIAFIFDENRKAVLLIGGDKKGSEDKDFYRWMIRMAEGLYERYRA